MISIPLKAGLALLAILAVLALPALVPRANADMVVQASHARTVFTGAGIARLGTVRLRHRAILRWRAARGLQLYDRRGFMVLNSHAHHGRLTLRRGVYRGLRVVTPGRWRIVIRARR